MYQKLIIVGNLGRSPEARFMPDGRMVCNFSVAQNETWNDRETGERCQRTTWMRVSAFGRRAETAYEYLRKGHLVLVEGRLRPDPNTGGPRLWIRQDGSYGASYEMTADVVKFMTPKGDTYDLDDPAYYDATGHTPNGTGRRRPSSNGSGQRMYRNGMNGNGATRPASRRPAPPNNFDDDFDNIAQEDVEDIPFTQEEVAQAQGKDNLDHAPEGDVPEPTNPVQNNGYETEPIQGEEIPY